MRTCLIKSSQTRNTCGTDYYHRLLLQRNTIICETVNIILSFLSIPVSYETVISCNDI